MDSNIIKYEKINNYYYYTCSISKSFIIFDKNNDVISIYDTNFNWNEPKLVMNLLNFSLGDIIAKSKNICVKYFSYIILKNELDLLNKDKWNIIKDDNTQIELQCNIEDCLENVISGFLLDD